MILARIYASFRENHRKLRTARSASATGDWTWHLPFTSFKRRNTQALVGLRTDSLTSIPYPGFKPGTFGASAGFPNHFTASRLNWEEVDNKINSVKGNKETTEYKNKAMHDFSIRIFRKENSFTNYLRCKYIMKWNNKYSQIYNSCVQNYNKWRKLS